MSQKPSIPSGTRDFLPREVAQRNYIFETIRSIFIKHGFEQIETPAIENLSTLLGKYGEEGDKLLYKILNSGNPLDKVEVNELQTNPQQCINKICEKGLRYDLTVPFARYVVQHKNEIVFPFRRFQIQPVWRADRPQKGRYREFFQCDIDIVGSKSLYNEGELLQVVDEVFKALGIKVAIHLNNRKILAGIAEYLGSPEKLVPITVAIDKIDKVGFEKVAQELLTNGINEEAIEELKPILYLEGVSNGDKLAFLENCLTQSEIGKEGIREIRELLEIVKLMGLENDVVVDLSLARGLSYYTGAIFEVKALEVPMGSITGGGRYDDLTALFGLKGVSGVGLSFGADRIYDVLTQLNKFPQEAIVKTDILVLNLGEEYRKESLELVELLRGNGKNVAYYPDKIKIGKQFDYANKRGIRLVILIGQEEKSEGCVKIKNMESGEQKLVTIDQMIELLKLDY